jgi:hypothetical protein
LNKRVNPAAVLMFLVTLAFYVAAAKAGHGGSGLGHGFFSGG